LVNAVDVVLPAGDAPYADTIVIVKVKVGRGSAAANVSRNYCVMEICEIYYNKWFVVEEGRKKWKKEDKKDKLNLWMLRKYARGEFYVV